MALVRGLMTLVATLCLGTGFGHAALGRTRRGFLWCAALFATLTLSIVWFWSFALAGAIFLGALIDAFVCGYRAKTDPRWLRWSTVAITVSSIAFALAMRVWVLESFKLPSSSMYPTLEIGDHVLINKRASVGRGDVIVFRYPCDPSRDYLKRVVALGGDTVEVRCSVVYVNGKAVPSALVQAEATYNDYDERDQVYFTRASSRYREVLDDVTYDVFQDTELPKRPRDRVSGDPRDFPMRAFAAPPSCEMADVHPASTGATGQIVETKSEVVASACEPQLHYVVPAGQVFVLGDNRSNSNDSRIWGALPDGYVRGRVLGIWWTSGNGMSSPSRFGPVY
jgi:signal peptidase I